MKNPGGLNEPRKNKKEKSSSKFFDGKGSVQKTIRKDVVICAVIDQNEI